MIFPCNLSKNFNEELEFFDECPKTSNATARFVDHIAALTSTDKSFRKGVTELLFNLDDSYHVSVHFRRPKIKRCKWYLLIIRIAFSEQMAKAKHNLVVGAIACVRRLMGSIPVGAWICCFYFLFLPHTYDRTFLLSNSMQARISGHGP